MKKKKVLVTGASRGIGRAIAYTLSKDYCLILHASKPESLASLMDELGDGHEVLCANFSDVDETKAFCSALKKLAGPSLYGVVNNAGIALDKPLMYQSMNDMDKMLNINVKAPLLIAKTALKLFIGNKEGVIINIGSCVGETGNGFQVVYAMTKAAMVTMSKSIAKEIALIDKSLNIRAITVSPGFIDTDMTKNLSEAVKEKYLEMIPSSYFGHPNEVANVVQFALSAEAKYINGTNIAVNGGIV